MVSHKLSGQQLSGQKSYVQKVSGQNLSDKTLSGQMLSDRKLSGHLQNWSNVIRSKVNNVK